VVSAGAISAHRQGRSVIPILNVVGENAAATPAPMHRVDNATPTRNARAENAEATSAPLREANATPTQNVVGENAGAISAQRLVHSVTPTQNVLAGYAAATPAPMHPVGNAIPTLSARVVSAGAASVQPWAVSNFRASTC
jgi:hypothetical protein